MAESELYLKLRKQIGAHGLGGLMNSYNGFSPDQRRRKLMAMNLLLATGELARPSCPCELCGDPDVPVEFHDEDYSEPFSWEPPAAYRICRPCHQRLHQRFAHPLAWQAFVAHVRRGGYAADLLIPAISAELTRYQESLARRLPMQLAVLRDYPRVVGREWFAHLRKGTKTARRSPHPPAVKTVRGDQEGQN